MATKHVTSGQYSPSAPELRSTQSKNGFIKGTVTVEPSRTKQIPLGAYSASEPAPQFALSLKPDIGEQCVASLERLDIPGKPKYVLFYQLRNFSDTLCSVTVERRDSTTE